MKERNTDHVRCSDGSHYPFGMFCRHCGDFQKIARPIQIDVYLAAMQAYGRIHGKCKPQEGAAERLEREIALARLPR